MALGSLQRGRLSERPSRPRRPSARDTGSSDRARPLAHQSMFAACRLAYESLESVGEAEHHRVALVIPRRSETAGCLSFYRWFRHGFAAVIMGLFLIGPVSAGHHIEVPAGTGTLDVPQKEASRCLMNFARREVCDAHFNTIAESRRVDGKVRLEHIAALGSVGEPATIAGRIAFWLELRPRLDKLDNRIGDQQIKILDAIHARIPMVTPDEMRDLQRENAEADARLWEGLQGMNAGLAEGHKDVAAKSARIAADSEKRAADAAAKAVKAKERLDHLAKGEDVSGGLGKPMTREQMEKILKDNGMTDSDIRFSVEFAQASLSEEEFEAYVQEVCAASRGAEKASRRKLLRKIIAGRAHRQI
jgi:hypothetical protein